MLKPGGAAASARWGCAISAAIGLAALAAWEILARAGAISMLFFPPPSTVAATLGRLAASGTLGREVSRTLARLFAAFIIGAVPAAALGLAMGWSRRLRVIVDPFIAAFHPVPKTALLPLLMILLGLGESSKIAVAALASFFPVLINSMAGVRQISPIHFEVAENYHASPLKVLTHVVWPGSLPMVLSGARLGFNSALVVTIAVELLTARHGLGAMIWMAWETMRTEELYASILIAAFLGIVFNVLLKRATQRLVPWQVERQI